MHIIIVGAQPVGEHLMQLSLDAGYDVTLIEPHKERAERCAQEYDAQVLQAEIGEEDILEEAGADGADALVATTEDDSVNLMAMVLGQEYEITNLVSTVNASHRKALFERLGVSTLVDPEVLAARYLLHLMIYPGSENVTPLAGEGQVYEVTLGENSRFVDREVNALYDGSDLPRDVYIVLIRREGKHLRPDSRTPLAAGDVLLVFSVDPLSQDDLALFTGADE